jgi:hypothetical protein
MNLPALKGGVLDPTANKGHIPQNRNGEKYMERSFPLSQGYKLESQIRESFGRVVYTEICHNKIIQRLLWRIEASKVIPIILSALTTVSFLITIFVDEKISIFFGAIFSAMRLFGVRI